MWSRLEKNSTISRLGNFGSDSQSLNQNNKCVYYPRHYAENHKPLKRKNSLLDLVKRWSMSNEKDCENLEADKFATNKGKILFDERVDLGFGSEAFGDDQVKHLSKGCGDMRIDWGEKKNDVYLKLLSDRSVGGAKGGVARNFIGDRNSRRKLL